jgi:hypothetical protein
MVLPWFYHGKTIRNVIRKMLRKVQGEDFCIFPRKILGKVLSKVLGKVLFKILRKYLGKFIGKDLKKS